MKMMHLISGGDVGGAKTQVLTMLWELSKHHQAKLCCFMDGPFAQEARQMGISTMVLQGKNPSQLTRMLRKELETGGYEILHCHGSKANLFGSILRGKLTIPVVSTVHSDPKLDYLGRPIANMTYGVANRRALRRMDGWVAVSDAMKETLIRDGLDADRIHVIYNGIPFYGEPEHTTRSAYLSSLDIQWGEDCVIYGIAARLNPVKDVKTLIRAFGEAAKQCDNIRLLIAGDGEQRQELEEMAGSLCPPDTVKFIGWQTDMNSFYHSLNVNMLSSISETFPYAITEGARMGCATISTAVGGIPKVVIDGKTGFLVDPGDWQTMARRIVSLAGDAKLRSSLGQGIYEKVRREFSSQVMAQRQIQIYQTVIRRDRKRRGAAGRYGVVVCGAYGRGNMGDDAILQTVIRQLRMQDPDLPICVMTRKPVETALETGVSTVQIFHAMRASKWMKRSTLYISGGGTLLQNATSTRSLIYYLFSMIQAKKCGCRVMLYGCGAGPVRGKGNQRLVARVLNRYADQMTLRDPASRQTLERFGVTVPKCMVTADPALGMQADTERTPEFLRKNGMDLDQKYALFVLRPWSGMERRLDAVRQAAEYVYRRWDLMPVFMCFEPSRDQNITHTAADGLQVPYKILTGESDCSIACGVIARSQLVVAMRLHALVFACSQDVPMVGISYDPKVSGFMDYAGDPHHLALEELSGERLCSLIDQALEQHQSTNNLRLRALAEENGAIAGKMLRNP